MNSEKRPGAGVNLPGLRGHNAALVLDLLRGAGGGGVGRLELAERTGLTPQAVSKIVARLRGEGLVADAGRRASTGGKPQTLLRLVPEAGYAVGVQLERDALVAVLVDLAGVVVAERRAGLDFSAGVDSVVDVAVEAVVALVSGALAGLEAGMPRAGGCAHPSPSSRLRSSRGDPYRPAEHLPTAVEHPPAAVEHPPAAVGQPPTGVLGVGVALPGPLDHASGVLQRVTGFPEWDGYPLRDVLARRLGLPVVVDKDTNAAALGLALGGDAESFAYLHLGTGLGAGLVLGGGVYRGARTGAGEFGHQVVRMDGPLCECGARGCVEALCLAAVARGDLDEAARALGTAAGNLVALLDIDLVLLGGRTVGAAEELFVRGVGAVVAERARREGAGAAVGVRVAPGGERGVAEGAAQLVLAPLFGRASAAFPANRT
ncbi:ROK family transcriptional regulator [Streptomyces alboflavus]|uniref:ROK family transcriptional regulator n=1 Tax=Streptomyces alboflavus TaxID=67267 RepID=UPI003699CE49